MAVAAEQTAEVEPARHIPSHGRGVLIPWVKGKSGNPAGVSAVRRQLNAEIERLHAGQNVLDVLERFRVRAMTDETMVGVVAGKIYLDRVLGPQKEAPAGGATAQLSPDEIRARIAQVVLADPAFREQMRAMLERPAVANGGGDGEG